MRIRILGQVRAWDGDDEIDLGPPGQRAVLGLLVLAGGEPVPRAEIVDAVWGARPPGSATNIIHTRVKHLRRILDPHRRTGTRGTVLQTVGTGYALHLPADAVDLTRFRDLAAAAADAHRAGDLPRAAALLAEALTLWQGPPLTDLPVDPEYPKLVRLAGERRAALTRYCDAMIEVGAALDALPLLAEAAAAEPLDEAVHVQLIRAQQAAGQRAQASTVYHTIRHRLADELGLDPGPELVEAHTGLLDPGGATVPAQLPPDTHGFVGRATELADLSRYLDTAGAAAPAVVAVVGTAGVGKTELALHWAHRVRHRFPDGQLFVDLRGYGVDEPMSPADVTARLLRALGVPGGEIPADPDERSARYRTEIAGRRILVVLDNADSAEQVRPLLPGTPPCAVVVTSRNSLAGLVTRHGAHRLDLDLLPHAEAGRLLTELIGDRARRDPDAVAELVRQCARLPLALRVAAEYATAHPTVALRDLVDDLRDDHQRLEILDAGGDPRTAVGTVFSWSYNGIPADARRLFRLLAVQPCPALDAPAAAALADVPVPDARRLLRELTRAHLVTHDDGRYASHDLLRAYALGRCRAEDPPQARLDAVTRLVEHQRLTGAA